MHKIRAVPVPRAALTSCWCCMCGWCCIDFGWSCIGHWCRRNGLHDRQRGGARSHKRVYKPKQETRIQKHKKTARKTTMLRTPRLKSTKSHGRDSGNTNSIKGKNITFLKCQQRDATHRDTPAYAQDKNSKRKPNNRLWHKQHYVVHHDTTSCVHGHATK